MNIVRFEYKGRIRHGVIEGDRVRPLAGGLFETRETLSEWYKTADVQLLAPVLPSKVVAVGLNYRDHAEEMGKPLPAEPLLFIKPSTSVIGPQAPIVHPGNGERVDYEAELAAVVGKTLYRLSEEQVPAHLLGYTCLNDVTARDMQNRDVQYTRSKSFDTFCPVGPCIETDIDPCSAAVRCRINGETKQYSNTANHIFTVYRLVSYISHIMTLLPGDIVTTGTPSGVGPMHPGDVVEVEVEGIGVLRNQVISSDER
jgi:2-keto-4-pentenoate hydratase/2-oxohepta-3-ene-1,7-dioic acid hydratase in catechol pathway